MSKMTNVPKKEPCQEKNKRNEKEAEMKAKNDIILMAS